MAKNAKNDKKIARVQEQLTAAETELRVAITKKVSSAMEVSVPTLTSRIKKLGADLAALKKNA